MSLGSVPTKAKENILARIICGLSEYYLEDQYFPRISRENMAYIYDIFLPLPKKAREKLWSLIGEHHPWAYIDGMLHAYAPFDEVEEGTKLSAVVDIDEIAIDILEKTLALPNKYEAVIETSFDQLGGTTRSISIAPGMTLWQPTDEEIASYPVPGSIPGIRRGKPGSLLSQITGWQPYAWSSAKIYLKMEFVGYLSSYWHSPMLESFERTLKALIGSCETLDLVESHGPSSGDADDIAVCYFAIDGRPEFVRSERIIGKEANYLQKLTIPRKNFIDPMILLTAQINNEPIDIENYENIDSQWFVKKLGPISRLFAARESDPAQKILNAAHWYTDGNTQGFDAMGFIQSVTAIEALLGDTKRRRNLTQLLANRCAYMIGRNAAERDAIETNFEDIYKKRSEILHQGNRMLTGDYLNRLAELRHYLKRALQKEIQEFTS